MLASRAPRSCASVVARRRGLARHCLVRGPCSRSLSTNASARSAPHAVAVESPVLKAKNHREISREDLISVEQYAKLRRSYLQLRAQNRKLRRVGPDVSFAFETYDTLWVQVQEMLLIEKGGPEQIDEELYAYNPLVPKGNELIATVMFEIDNPIIRKKKLSGLGDVDQFMFLEYGIPQRHLAIPATDLPRTKAGEKASAIQFMKWTFTPEQATAFLNAKSARLGICHPNYDHSSGIGPELLQALKADLKL